MYRTPTICDIDNLFPCMFLYHRNLNKIQVAFYFHKYVNNPQCHILFYVIQLLYVYLYKELSLKTNTVESLKLAMFYFLWVVGYLSSTSLMFY